MFGGFYGADHLTFEGVMGDFRKNVLQTDFGKKHANKFLGKKYPALKKMSLMTYNAEKNLHRYISGKKFLTPERLGKKFSN